MAAHYAHTRRYPSSREAAQIVSFPLNAKHDFGCCSNPGAYLPRLVMSFTPNLAVQGRASVTVHFGTARSSERRGCSSGKSTMYQKMREANGLAMDAHNTQRTVTSPARCFPNACSSQSRASVV